MDSADTAWVLICAGLVMFMTPGLALFYGGMVRVRNVLVMLMQNFIPLGIVTLTWIFVGYSLAFSNNGNGFSGALDAIGLASVEGPRFHTVAAGVAIPTLAFVTYQMMFAIITPALITGATAGRLKIVGWAAFLVLWSIRVYPLIARWLWHPDGWLADLGAQDWAGGIVVHASAGAAAIAVLVVIGRRRDWPDLGIRPNNLPLMLAGTGILWFGWFGFNAGDGLQANALAAQAVLNTHVAAAAAMIAWLLVERFTEGHATIVGAASGAIAGLATITPCAGFVGTGAAVVIGLIAGVVCHTAIKLKFAFLYDDALDVIAVHFIGGVLGSLLLGFFGDRSVNSAGRDGVLHGGGSLLWYQVVALAAVVAFSFVVTWIIATVIERTIGLRVAPDEEDQMDRLQQRSDAYAVTGVAATELTANAAEPAPPPALTSRNGGGRHLVTSLVDSHRAEGLRDALVAAGAESIVLSEASAYTGVADVQVFRGHRRSVQFHERLRVEVTVGDAARAAVLDVLAQFGADHDAYVLDISSVR
ncbi:MAG: ammonium transporter [Acidimicrobiales bacterium]|nr:ammonium transporter [Acidimicrobiales bacterium]